MQLHVTTAYATPAHATHPRATHSRGTHVRATPPHATPPHATHPHAKHAHAAPLPHVPQHREQPTFAQALYFHSHLQGAISPGAFPSVPVPILSVLYAPLPGWFNRIEILTAKDLNEPPTTVQSDQGPPPRRVNPHTSRHHEVHPRVVMLHGLQGIAPLRIHY